LRFGNRQNACSGQISDAGLGEPTLSALVPGLAKVGCRRGLRTSDGEILEPLRRTSAMAGNECLVLYHFAACSYCALVRAAAERLGVELEFRDIRENEAYAQELLEAMGRMTVPVLRIEAGEDEDQWLPESAEIIQYLEERTD